MKTAVVYWSGTGNTEAIAEAVANGGAGCKCAEVYTKLWHSGRRSIPQLTVRA